MSVNEELQTIDEQIAALAAKRKSILDAKRSDVLKEVQRQVAVFGFTASELGLGTAKTTSVKVAAKYANPANPAQTWHGGKGPKPKWVREFLVNGGNLEEALIAR